jgi:hypothetical protein
MGDVHRLHRQFPNEPVIGRTVGLLSEIERLLSRRLKEEIDHAQEQPVSNDR